MRTILAVATLVAIAPTLSVSADNDVCANFRIAEAEYLENRAGADINSDAHIKMIDTYVRAQMAVRGSSGQEGFGAHTVVKVVEHLKETADLTYFAVLQWLVGEESQESRAVASLAYGIMSDSGKLVGMLADVICQMREAGD